MSKAFIINVLQTQGALTGASANELATTLIDAIVREMKRSGRFALPSFGTFKVAKLKARNALNPKTGEKVRTKASKTVRFKASPVLRKAV